MGMQSGMGMHVMPRSGSVSGLVNVPGVGMLGGRSMSVPIVPFGHGVRNGGLGTISPRSYGPLGPVDDFDSGLGLGAAGFGRLPPIPIPRSVPVSIQPAVDMNNGGFVLANSSPADTEYSDIHGFEAEVLDLSTASGEGSSGNSTAGGSNGSDFRHGNNGRYEDRWGRWHEVLAL